MLPSKKIFVGATAIAAGILGQVLVAVLVAVTDTAGLTAEAAERLQSHLQLGLNGMTISWILLLMGLLFLFVGVWQNAKFTEHLAARLEALEMKR
jgi:hypothetical protein